MFKKMNEKFKNIDREQYQNHAEVSNLLVSLGHTGRRRVVLGHTLDTLQHVITKKSHNVLRKFTILCWAAFTAILSCMQPAGDRLDTPVRGYPLTAMK